MMSSEAYLGQINDSQKRHGKGSRIKNGEIYEGYFENGIFIYGRMFFKEGGTMIEGKFLDGVV